MSHISGAFRNGTSLFIFGGCTSSCCFAPVNTAWELTLSPTLDSGTWAQLLSPPSSSSPIPSARFGAASVVNTQHDVLYAFGGQDSSQAFLADLWSYHHGSNQWTKLTSSRLHRGPSARAAATLSIVSTMGRKHLVLVGGFGRQGASNEVWAVDLMGVDNHEKAPVIWMKLEAETGEEEGEGEGGIREELPKRWHHVAVEDGQGGLVMVGGSDEVGVDHNEAFLLTFDWGQGTYRWRELAGNEEEDAVRPSVRHGHVALFPTTKAAATGRDHFLVFGGMNTTANTLPSSFLSDAFRLDLASEAWTEAEGGPGARAYAAVGYGPTHTLVYGGFAGFLGDTDDRLLGDVWVYRHEEVEEEEEEEEGGWVVRESRRRQQRLLRR